MWFAGLVRAAFSPDDGFKIWGMITVASAIAFVIGVVIATIRKNWRPFGMAISFLLSFVVVGVAGLLRGKIHGELVATILWTLTALQLLIVACTLYLSRGARAATALLIPLCGSFWMFAGLIATMSFEDTWL